MPLTIVEGYTGALDFDLLSGGVPVLLTSDDEVALILRTREGHVIATSSSVSTQGLGASSSETFVRYLPDSGDLNAAWSPYAARFRVRRLGRDVFYPSGDEADPWTVGTP